jgi:hypothetical protein
MLHCFQQVYMDSSSDNHIAMRPCHKNVPTLENPHHASNVEEFNSASKTPMKHESKPTEYIDGHTTNTTTGQTHPGRRPDSAKGWQKCLATMNAHDNQLLSGWKEELSNHLIFVSEILFCHIIHPRNPDVIFIGWSLLRGCHRVCGGILFYIAGRSISTYSGYTSADI